MLLKFKKVLEIKQIKMPKKTLIHNFIATTI